MGVTLSECASVIGPCQELQLEVNVLKHTAVLDSIVARLDREAAAAAAAEAAVAAKAAAAAEVEAPAAAVVEQVEEAAAAGRETAAPAAAATAADPAADPAAAATAVATADGAKSAENSDEIMKADNNIVGWNAKEAEADAATSEEHMSTDIDTPLTAEDMVGP